VRAAATSQIPIISAVGHETDWTLIDLAADARAPTPTKAAEWAVPKHAELVVRTGELGQRLRTAVLRRLEEARAHWRAAVRGLPRREDLLALPRQRFDAVEKRLGRALAANTQAHAKRLARIAPRLQPRLLTVRLERAGDRLQRLAAGARDALSRGTAARRARFERLAGRLQPGTVRERLRRADERLAGLAARLSRAAVQFVAERRRALAGQAQLLGSLSYQSVLRRGYALVRDETGRAVRSVTQVRYGERLDVELADGRIPVRAEGGSGAPASTEPVDMSARRSSLAPRQGRGRSGSGEQGSLF
jgi:exodeoxyribonuclease VII large subunit